MFVIANIMLQMAIQYGIIHLLVICILEDTPLNGGRTMHITYKRLWKLLIDREMNRQDLKKLCNLSSASVAKLGKCENITTDVLVRICEGLNCKLEDIMELEEDAVQAPSPSSEE
jgi:Predicted transcriptional regulator